MRHLALLAAVSVLLLAAGPLAAEQSKQVSNGKAIYVEHCQRCHGADGKRGEGFQTPIWGPGAQIKKFENALTLFEYMQLLMPFDDPKKIDDQARWDVIAYMLVNHRALQPGDTLDPAKASEIAIK